MASAPEAAVPVAPLVSVGDSRVSGMSNPNHSGSSASKTPNHVAKIVTPNRASISASNRVPGSNQHWCKHSSC